MFDKQTMCRKFRHMRSQIILVFHIKAGRTLLQAPVKSKHNNGSAPKVAGYLNLNLLTSLTLNPLNRKSPTSFSSLALAISSVL